MPRHDKTPEHRFFEKVWYDPETGCLEWMFSTVSGYGQFYLVTPKRAHRVAYEWAGGTLYTNMEIDHLCRNRRCVNPAHLQLVTHRENWARGMSRAAVATRTGVCGHGHKLAWRSSNGRGGCRQCKNKNSREWMRAKRARDAERQL